jgi:salicylate hydroxylase
MLPFSAQGANQAIEDAGALGLLLATVDDPAELPRRLELFETIRLRRASRVQLLSSVRAGREHLVEDKIKKYLEDGVPCEFLSYSVMDILRASTIVTSYYHSINIFCNESLVPNTLATRIAHDSG